MFGQDQLPSDERRRLELAVHASQEWQDFIEFMTGASHTVDIYVWVWGSIEVSMDYRLEMF